MGERTGGFRYELEHLPDFDPACPIDEAQLAKFLKGPPLWRRVVWFLRRLLGLYDD